LPQELCLVNRNNAQLFSTYSQKENDLYDLMGYEGSAGLLWVRKQEVILLVDGRYIEQCRKKYGGDPMEKIVVEHRDNWMERLLKPWHQRYRGRGGGMVYLDESRWSSYDYDQLTSMCADVMWKDRQFVTRGFLGGEDLDRTAGAEVLLDDHRIFGDMNDSVTKGDGHHEERLALLRSHMKKSELHIMTCPDDVAWLTGMRSMHFDYRRGVDAVILMTSMEVMLFIDRSDEEMELLSGVFRGWKIVAQKNAWRQVIRALLKKMNATVCYPYHVRPGAMNAKGKNEMLAACHSESEDGHVVSLDKRFNTLKHSLCELGRLEKSPMEQECMARSQKKLSDLMSALISEVQDRMSKGRCIKETDVVNLSHQMAREAGAIRPCFPAMAASGPHSMHPHHQPTSRILKNGELLLLDIGYYFDESLYATDMSRTILLGKDSRPLKEQRRIYTMTLIGFLRQWGATFVAKQLKGFQLDSLARDYFEKHVGDEYGFIHSTGHGVGISDHELGITIGPSSRLSMRPGYTYSIEPGLYRLKNSELQQYNFGVRIEDVVTVIIGENGVCEHRSLGPGSFDDRLVDESLMSEDDLALLGKYRAEIPKE
jgi:Xaa-Pro aminopeptidase